MVSNVEFTKIITQFLLHNFQAEYNLIYNWYFDLHIFSVMEFDQIWWLPIQKLAVCFSVRASMFSTRYSKHTLESLAVHLI